jgi:hypothetical protein
VLRRGKVILAIATLFVAGASVGTAGPKASGGLGGSVNSDGAVDAAPQKATGTPGAAAGANPNKKVVAAEDYTKKLLLLMDTDKNGKVSKKEFMSFMEKEFDRLDTNHDGELDVKELAALRVRPYLGK